MYLLTINSIDLQNWTHELDQVVSSERLSFGTLNSFFSKYLQYCQCNPQKKKIIRILCPSQNDILNLSFEFLEFAWIQSNPIQRELRTFRRTLIIDITIFNLKTYVCRLKLHIPKMIMKIFPSKPLINKAWQRW